MTATEKLTLFESFKTAYAHGAHHYAEAAFLEHCNNSSPGLYLWYGAVFSGYSCLMATKLGSVPSTFNDDLLCLVFPHNTEQPLLTSVAVEQD